MLEGYDELGSIDEINKYITAIREEEEDYSSWRCHCCVIL